MFKKIIFCLVIISFALALTQVNAFIKAEKDFTKGKLTNCQKVWNQWFKIEHALAKTDLKDCLENATNKEEREICQNTYKDRLKELRKQRKENKKECVECLKASNDVFKEARKQAKANLDTCLAGATEKEARKVCRDQYKEDLKNARKDRKEARKECLKVEEID